MEEHDLAARGLRRRTTRAEPRLEGLVRKGRQRAAPIDAGHLLEQPPVGGEIRKPVRQPGHERAHAVQTRDAAEEPVAQRQAVLLIVVVQELVLHLRHVHVRRALGLAALALEAEVHHLVEPAAREFRRRQLPGQHRAQRVRGPVWSVLVARNM